VKAKLQVGDEIAHFSAARHSGIPATIAIVTAWAFGCGCAALRSNGRKHCVFWRQQLWFRLRRAERFPG